MTEQGQATRVALLGAARRAFARHGFAGASVRGIARDRTVASMASATSPQEAARNAMRTYLQHLVENPELPHLIQRCLLEDDEVALAVASHWQPIVDAIQRILPPTDDPLRDPPEVYITLQSAVVAPFLYERLLTEVFPLAEAALLWRVAHLDALVALMLDGPG
jgi:AcrR family transcriptional regulator